MRSDTSPPATSTLAPSLIAFLTDSSKGGYRNRARGTPYFSQRLWALFMAALLSGLSTVGGYRVTDMSPRDVGIGREPREVHRGEALGTIYSPYTFEELEQIQAPCDGLIYACRVSGPVEPQSEVLAVADYEDSKWI
jgi:hypothetical protein